ncbi:MAG: hypothetical protein GY704_05780 [Phycisphaeraceae bacterium]|nr:hypothetical protein [Phycisphaeraceae bacterium]
MFKKRKRETQGDSVPTGSRLGSAPSVRNRHERHLVAVLADCSSSMTWEPGAPGEPGRVGHRPIDALNNAIPDFLAHDLPSVKQLIAFGDVALGSFNSVNKSPVSWLKLENGTADSSHPFYGVTNDLKLPHDLVADGQTPMGTALLDALRVLELHRIALTSDEDRPVSVRRPGNLFLITDGVPEGESEERFAEAREELQDAERGDRVRFWSIGTEGADMELLRSLSLGGSENAWELSRTPLRKILKLITFTTDTATQAGAGGGGPEAFYRSVRERVEKRGFFTEEERSFYDDDL